MRNKRITANNIELGQMAFGNPVGEFDCPDFVEALFSRIYEEIDRVYWNVHQEQYANYEDPKMKGIESRLYYWGEDDKEACLPNFSYKGVELRWYKHFGRSMTVNVSKTPQQWKEWFDDCISYIRSLDDKDL